MPKIIENLEPRLLSEAQHQIESHGYSAMTIRSVASACGVGIGTVYNYFQSKDDLIATYMLRDWTQCIALIHSLSAASDSPESVAHGIYDQLLAYSNRHASILKDPSAASSFAGSFSRYHALLRQQLAASLRKFCADDFTSEFISESLLTWTMAGKDFDEIYGIIGKLFVTVHG